MRARVRNVPLAVAAWLLALCLLLACANLLAGAILFISYGEHPGRVDFLTIERAYLMAAEARALARVKASAALSLLVCFGVPFGLAMMWRRRGDSDLFGHARFADRADIRKEKLDAGKGIVIGKFKRRLLRLSGYEFVLLAAPTRTGKGVGFCVPNLLQFDDSAVVLDIKGENYNLTSEFRRRYMGNEIYYFNPFAEDTHRWNPLSYVSADPKFRANDLMALATVIYPPNEKEPFWPDSARNLFVGLGLLVLETPELPKTIGEILRQGSGKGNPVELYLAHVLALRAASGAPLSMACRDSLNRFIGAGETALKGIVATFTAALTPFANPVIDKATSGDDFDLRDVRKRKMTIYLNIPAGEIMQAGFLVNLFFSQLINENVKELPEHNPALRHQCLLLLDEFTAMGKVSIIAKGVGYMAGYNMRLAIIIQDRSQLEAVYGKEDAHNIVSNMGALIYFTPTQVSEAEEYSKMIGNNTVNSYSVQHAKGTLFGLKGAGGDSRTASYQSRAVMLPQELLQMSKDAQLIVRAGIPVIKADKIRYFDDRFFKERFEAVPMHAVSIGNERRRVPLPVPQPKGDWTAYEAALAATDHYALMPPPEPNRPAPAAAAGNPEAPLSDAQSAFAIVDPAAGEAHHAGTDAAATAPTWLAYAFASSIVAFGRSLAGAGLLRADEQLGVIDLTCGEPQFAWQVLGFLQQLAAESGPGMPGFRYLACADEHDPRAALHDHPYFAPYADAGMFLSVERAGMLAGGLRGGRPQVVLAPALAAGPAMDWPGLRDACGASPTLILGGGAGEAALAQARSLDAGAAAWTAVRAGWSTFAALASPEAIAYEPGPAMSAALAAVPERPERPATLAGRRDWLARMAYDPACLAPLLPDLLDTDWRQAPPVRGPWRDTLARVWALVLPDACSPSFLFDVADLAMLLGYPGLAREACSHVSAVDRDATDAWVMLANISDSNGRIGQAIEAWRHAQELAPGHAAAVAAQIARLGRRLAAYDALPWYQAEIAEAGPVWFEPLGAQHAIVVADGLADGPDHAGVRVLPAPEVDAVRAWIDGAGLAGGINAVFLHEDLGLLGIALVAQAAGQARLDVWRRAAWRGEQLMDQALAAFLERCIATGAIDGLFSVLRAAPADPAPWPARVGFARIDAGPAWRDAALEVFYLGAGDGTQCLAQADSGLDLHPDRVAR